MSGESYPATTGGAPMAPITVGTSLTGGTNTIAVGSIATIPSGPKIIPNGAMTAIGTTIMRGTTALGGMKTVPIGSANIIMSGPDGMTTTNE